VVSLINCDSPLRWDDRMLDAQFEYCAAAFGAHLEVGHGGHFLGAAHTMERFRTCFYRPLLSSTANFERWLRPGGKDAAVRADEIWRGQLEAYEPPPLDDAVRAELDDYVARRRRDLGD
jgi:trimethylamine--corrinoid protein Co-methyltransferase